MTGKHVLAIVAVIVLSAVVALTDQQQVLVLKDGRRLKGEVTKTEKGYQIRMYGGVVVFTADQVLRVEDIELASEELNKRLGKVAPGDAEGFYKVARWAYDRELLTESKKILLKTLKLKPNHERAELLLKLINSRLAKTATDVTPVKPTTSRPGVKPPITHPKLNPSMFLTEEDIYRIRLMELRPKDKVRIVFRKNVLKRFKKSMRGMDIFEDRSGEKKFDRYSPIKKVMYILDHTGPNSVSIRNDILIKSDPSVMKEFRTRVWPILSRSFANANSFGGVKDRDGLKLYNLSIADNRILYTNFYILHKWQRGGLKFIHRKDQEMSLLLQWGLPRKLAKLPAPKYLTMGFPVFRDPKDRKFKIISDWIASLRWPFLTPGYRIDFKLPGQKPEKTPTTTTTSAPAETDERRRD